MIRLFLLGTICLIGCKNSRYQYGQSLYEAYCQNCHMEDGSGLGLLIPPISNSDYLANNYSNLACIIKFGIEDTIVVNGNIYNNPMKGIETLTDIQIANLINFLREKWYPEQSIVNPEMVNKKLLNCSE